MHATRLQWQFIYFFPPQQLCLLKYMYVFFDIFTNLCNLHMHNLLSSTEVLDAPEGVTKIQPYQLREKCLFPLQLALESKNIKLAQHALAGMQVRDHNKDLVYSVTCVLIINVPKFQF